MQNAESLNHREKYFNYVSTVSHSNIISQNDLVQLRLECIIHVSANFLYATVDPSTNYMYEMLEPILNHRI